jgi:hypothetical protein
MSLLLLLLLLLVLVLLGVQKYSTPKHARMPRITPGAAQCTDQQHRLCVRRTLEYTKHCPIKACDTQFTKWHGMRCTSAMQQQLVMYYVISFESHAPTACCASDAQRPFLPAGAASNRYTTAAPYCTADSAMNMSLIRHS